MGIWGLNSFVTNKVPGGTAKVDIRKAISEWKRTHSSSSQCCLIVVDVNGLKRQLVANPAAALCGHRYWLLAAAMADFFRLLQSLGVQFAFFVDGRPQLDKMAAWQKRRAAKYALVNALTDATSGRGRTLEQLSRGQLGQEVSNFNRPDECALVELCEQFGQVHRSEWYECDWELAKYATDNGAMAVLAEDSDFLIFAGNWQYWSANQLDTGSLQTIEYSRTALRDHLRLDDWQMAYLATLCGNDLMPFNELRTLHQSQSGYTKFDKVANFVRTEITKSRSPMQPHIDTLAARYDFNAQKCRNSVDSYDITIVDDSHETAPQLLRDAFGCPEVFHFLLPQVDPISFCDFDHRQKRLLGLRQLFLPLYQRQAGIVWQDGDHLRRLADAGIIQLTPDGRKPLLTRLSHAGNWEEIQVTPICPTFGAPPLKKLLMGSGDSDALMATRYRLLGWLITGKSPEDDAFVARIRALPTGYVLVSLVLFYLTQMGQFTVDEADSILRAEMDVIEQRAPAEIEYPEYIDAHDLLLARLYVRFYVHMKSSVRLCGLTSVLGAEERLRFDSVHFHKCRQQPEQFAAVNREHFEQLRMFYHPKVAA